VLGANPERQKPEWFSWGLEESQKAAFSHNVPVVATVTCKDIYYKWWSLHLSDCGNNKPFRQNQVILALK
jgi:hypothetical protein